MIAAVGVLVPDYCVRGLELVWEGEDGRGYMRV